MTCNAYSEIAKSPAALHGHALLHVDAERAAQRPGPIRTVMDLNLIIAWTRAEVGFMNTLNIYVTEGEIAAVHEDSGSAEPGGVTIDMPDSFWDPSPLEWLTPTDAA